MIAIFMRSCGITRVVKFPSSNKYNLIDYILSGFRDILSKHNYNTTSCNQCTLTKNIHSLNASVLIPPQNESLIVYR